MPARASKRTKTKKSPHLKDGNPELRRVERALRSFVMKCVPGTKETVNSWGVPTFEAPDPFCFYMVGKNHVTFGFSLRHFASRPAGAARRHREKHPACEAAHGGGPRADGPSGIGAGRGAPKGKGADEGDERATRLRLTERVSGSPAQNRQPHERDPATCCACSG
jgi:hypothetical protein